MWKRPKAGTRAEARFVFHIIVLSGNFRSIVGNSESQNDLGGYNSAIILPTIPAEMTGARESGAMTDDQETASCSARNQDSNSPLGPAWMSDKGYGKTLVFRKAGLFCANVPVVSQSVSGAIQFPGTCLEKANCE
jgi:hypothetical protein